MVPVVFVLAIAAAFSNAVTSILQRLGVESAPEEDALSIRLVVYALKSPVWIAGFLAMVVAFLFQAMALSYGDLSTVQPILTTELIFIVAILGLWFKQHLGWHEWLGATSTAAGLSGFLYIGSGRAGKGVPSSFDWLIVGASVVCAVAVTVILARRGSPFWKAAMFGTAGAITYAFTAALIKVTATYFAQDWVHVFEHWQTYGIAVAGLLAVFMAQNAFHAGPITASQSALVIVDPIASILIGITLFGDHLRTGGLRGPLEVFSLVVMFIGAFYLSHSPLVVGVKGDDQEGRVRSELLRDRRSRHGFLSGSRLGSHHVEGEKPLDGDGHERSKQGPDPVVPCEGGT